MKTDDFAALLASQVEAVPRHALARRLGLTLAAGTGLAAALVAGGYGTRPDLAQAMGWPMFWVKLLFPLCVAVPALVMVQRLGRPGVRLRGVWPMAMLPVLVIWGMGVQAWVTLPQEARMPALMGQTWRVCALNIGLISLPLFGAALLALRGAAPTRPALAGAAAGALAGGVAAALYALHCPELTAPFMAVWYVLGMALPVTAGALLGPRLLRW